MMEGILNGECDGFTAWRTLDRQGDNDCGLLGSLVSYRCAHGAHLIVTGQQLRLASNLVLRGHCSARCGGYRCNMLSRFQLSSSPLRKDATEAPPEGDNSCVSGACAGPCSNRLCIFSYSTVGLPGLTFR